MFHSSWFLLKLPSGLAIALPQRYSQWQHRKPLRLKVPPISSQITLAEAADASADIIAHGGMENIGYHLFPTRNNFQFTTAVLNVYDFFKSAHFQGTREIENCDARVNSDTGHLMQLAHFASAFALQGCREN